MRHRFVNIALAAVAGALASACAGDTQLDVRYAQGFAPGGHTVSVFGVYRDGLMTAETWDVVGTRVARALGGGPCELAYDRKLTRDQPKIAEAVDDATRRSGVTEDLVAQFAPNATGDAILVLTIAGHVRGSTAKPPERSRPGTAMPGGSTPPGRMGGSPSSFGGSGMPEREAPGMADPNAYELVASIYRAHTEGEGASHDGAVVALKYTGNSEDEAMQRFTQKLAEALPGAKCVGWTWSTAPDPDKIRATSE